MRKGLTTRNAGNRLTSKQWHRLKVAAHRLRERSQALVVDVVFGNGQRITAGTINRLKRKARKPPKRYYHFAWGFREATPGALEEWRQRCVVKRSLRAR